jgi:hypothetical protein
MGAKSTRPVDPRREAVAMAVSDGGESDAGHRRSVALAKKCLPVAPETTEVGDGDPPIVTKR